MMILNIDTELKTVVRQLHVQTYSVYAHQYVLTVTEEQPT